MFVISKAPPGSIRKRVCVCVCKDVRQRCCFLLELTAEY